MGGQGRERAFDQEDQAGWVSDIKRGCKGLVLVYDICPLSVSLSYRRRGRRERSGFWSGIEIGEKKGSITAMKIQFTHSFYSVIGFVLFVFS